MGRRPVAVASALAVALASTIGAAAAGAHARLAGSAPADGVALGGAPRQLELRFSEPISERFRVARLIDGHGHVVRGTVVRTGSDAARLVVRVPPLGRGAYQLNWEALAEDDGHITGGAITFGIKVRPRRATAAGAAPGTTVAPVKASLRWADLVLLCLLFGPLLVAGLLTGTGTPERPRRVLLGVAAGAAAAALVLGMALFARQVQQLRGSVAPDAAIGDLLGTRWGTLWIAREAILGALIAAVIVVRRRGSGVRFAACALLLAGLATVHALGAHAAADPQPLAAVPVAAAHVVAASVWMGGVAALALALAVAGSARGALARRLAGRFAVVAGCAVGLLAVTGLLAAGAQVASIDALLTTDYGRTLLIKATLTAVAAAFGAYNARALHRGRRPRLIVAEAAAGASVLLAAAVLSASPPANGPEFAAPRAVVAPTLVQQDRDLLVTATVRPNRPGPNVVTVLTASSRRPDPAPVRAVEIKLQRRGRDTPVTVELARVGSGRFAGGITLTQQGHWRATAILERGRTRPSVAFGWSVNRPDPARPVVHSARRLAPIVDRIALGLAFALALAAVAAGWARQRPRTTSVARIPAR